MRHRPPALRPLAGPVIVAVLLAAAPARDAAAAPDLPGPTTATKQAATAAHDVTRPAVMARAAAEVGTTGAAPAAPRGAVPAVHPAAGLTAAAAAGHPTREIFGFAGAGALGDPAVGYRSWDFRMLSTVAYFGLHVNGGDGSLVQGDTGWNVWHSSTASGLINTAHAAGVRVVVTFIYQDTSAGMCAALDH